MHGQVQAITEAMPELSHEGAEGLQAARREVPQGDGASQLRGQRRRHIPASVPTGDVPHVHNGPRPPLNGEEHRDAGRQERPVIVILRGRRPRRVMDPGIEVTGAHAGGGQEERQDGDVEEPRRPRPDVKGGRKGHSDLGGVPRKYRTQKETIGHRIKTNGAQPTSVIVPSGDGSGASSSISDRRGSA